MSVNPRKKISKTRLPFPNTTAPLYRHCGVCGIKKDLLRCTGCKLVQYCSKEHQAAKWPEHKSICATIRKRSTALEKEEKTLRATSNNGLWNNGDPFITGVGHFWGILDTRTYMRTRYHLIEAILKIKSLDAAESALDHLMDLLRLCRGDNMGVRSHVPPLLLRLGKDQECYDFITWWAITSENGDYDWGNMSLPFLDVKDADVFEPVDRYCGRFVDLGHTVSVTLLKIRLFLVTKECLRDVQNVAILRGRRSLPNELFDRIQEIVVRSLPGGEKWRDSNSVPFSQLASILSLQIDQMYQSVQRRNEHFWHALLNPGKHLDEGPRPYTRGSVQEMELVLQHSIDSWRETPGALEMIAARR